ncbi:hypothetical protein PLESTB_001222300 [Pleodorina starrii]|uniref:Uncharacterized protein n=1 Tax=Pleodorina starrii TaxID=330485 RepID=A0A9W6F5M7_9CHLO|nr:hypothetical protein PLESTB_001222300 [Pleodorina starrii]GLC77056.1 hypothetical protein PLESTF_001878600 [Pleodorina starrii]
MRIALVVISQTLVPIFRARQQLRRLRAAFQARVQAAIVLQAGVRLWLARRRLVLTVSAATKIQAAWRGHAVRRRAGWHKQEARRRLEQAALEARTAPHRHIGYRTREALEMLARHTKNLTQVVAAVEVIEVSTRYSRDCCDLIAQHGGLEALLQLVRSCNRSMPCQDVFDRTLAILSNICRHKALVSEVMHANGCLAALTERMQYFREEEEMFNPLVTLLQRLTATDALATDVPPSVTKSWEGILQLLQRTFEREKKYLERLEVQKGSDVSARESARKVVVVQQQIQSLELLINRCQTAKDEGPAAPDSARDKDKDQDKDATRKQATAGGKTATSVLAAQPPIPGYKNTLVKEAVRGMASGGHAPNTLNKATGVKRSGGGVTSSPVQPGKGSRPFNRRMDAS